MKKFSIILTLLISITLFACAPENTQVIIRLDGEMKTSYEVGDDSLDFGDLNVLIIEDTKRTSVPVTADMISGDYNLNAVGVYTIYVNYGDDRFSIEISVSEPDIANIMLTFPIGYSFDWFEGDKPDFDSVKLLVEFVNGKSVTYPVTADMFPELDTTRLGDQTVFVRYGGKEDSFTVVIHELNISGSAILTENFSAEFLQYSEANFDGLKIRLDFSDDRISEGTRSIEYDVTSDMVTDFDTSEAGPKEFTVTFRGCVQHVPYEVIALPEAMGEENFIFELDEWGGYSIALRSDVKLEGKVILPRKHEDLFVTSIKEEGFVNCVATEIELFRTIKAIGNGAFKNSALTSINLGQISYIGEGAFEDCRSLSQADLTEAVVIESRAFENCVALEEVIGGSLVARVGDRAFFNASSLSAVTFDNMSLAGDSIFSYCASLTSVSLKGIKELGSAAFSHCGALSQVTLSQILETIGARAFNYCVSLATLALPDSLRILGEGVFDNCTSLTTLSLPSVIELPAFTFNNCVALSQVVLSEKLERIGDYAFFGCKALRSLSLPESLLYIGTSAFGGCLSLSHIVIPASCVLSDAVFVNWGETQTIELSVDRATAQEKFDDNWDFGTLADIIYKV